MLPRFKSLLAKARNRAEFSPDLYRASPVAEQATAQCPPGATTAMGQPIVQLDGLTKRFGPITACEGISLDIRAGRVLALLGENGAGKSTLMAMLAGRLTPDAGSIIVDGQPTHLRGPAHALGLGIGMVYQRFSLVESMSVADNVLLGQEQSLVLDPAERRARVAALAEYFNLPMDPALTVGKLSMGERQRVEILRLLNRHSRVLILDEPTAVLTPSEAQQLFAAMRAMAARGCGIVFISHKLDEVLEVADDVAVLRKGKLTASLPASQAPSKAELARLMVGKDVVLAVTKPTMPLGDIVLEVQGLRAPGPAAWLKGIDLRLRSGEILAVVGVAGNGQKPLVEVLAGLREPTAGNIIILGRKRAEFFASPDTRRLAYIPEDRVAVATVPELDLTANYLLTERRRFSKGPLLDARAAAARTGELLECFDVRPRDVSAHAQSLSGGNLQKLVLARELDREPALIIAEQPTQGLDVAAAEDVWRRLVKAREHAAVLLVTGDLGEALALADRVAVMAGGRFVDVFPASDEAKVEGIGLMMTAT